VWARQAAATSGGTREVVAGFPRRLRVSSSRDGRLSVLCGGSGFRQEPEEQPSYLGPFRRGSRLLQRRTRPRQPARERRRIGRREAVEDTAPVERAAGTPEGTALVRARTGEVRDVLEPARLRLASRRLHGRDRAAGAASLYPRSHRNRCGLLLIPSPSPALAGRGAQACSRDRRVRALLHRLEPDRAVVRVVQARAPPVLHGCALPDGGPCRGTMPRKPTAISAQYACAYQNRIVGRAAARDHRLE
jgi:hypothetical protein